MPDTQMTEEYHKARHQLALFSGILLVWEYVGVKLGEPVIRPVTAKLPMMDTTVTIENPEVLPVVIAIVTMYFAFRLAVEWFQCDSSIRHSVATKIDLYMAYSIATAAMIVFVFQRATTFKLAELLTPQVALGLVVGLFVGIGASLFIWQVRFSRSFQMPRMEWLSEALRTPNISYLGFLLLRAIIFLFVWIEHQFKFFEVKNEVWGFVFRLFEVSQPLSIFFGWFIFALLLWFYRKHVFRESPIAV